MGFHFHDFGSERCVVWNHECHMPRGATNPNTGSIEPRKTMTQRTFNPGCFLMVRFYPSVLFVRRSLPRSYESYAILLQMMTTNYTLNIPKLLKVYSLTSTQPLRFSPRGPWAFCRCWANFWITILEKINTPASDHGRPCDGLILLTRNMAIWQCVKTLYPWWTSK